MIVLAYEHDAPGAIPCFDDGAVVVDVRKGRLLDEDVFARRQRSQRQLDMKAGRHGHDDRVHARIVNRGIVAGVARGALKAPAVLFGFRAIAARIAADDLGSKALQVTAVDLGDETAAQEREAQRLARQHEEPFTGKNVP